jgi:muramoyltetrapeptide carboxypeptidase
MMIQLKRSGMLDHLAGLVIGGFTEMKDTTIPFGADVYDVIAAHTREYDYPVCFGFPVSHEKENYALKVGAIYKLEVSGSRVSLREEP